MSFKRPWSCLVLPFPPCHALGELNFNPLEEKKKSTPSTYVITSSKIGLKKICTKVHFKFSLFTPTFDLLEKFPYSIFKF